MRNTIGELQRTPPPDGLQPEMRELQLDALRGTLGDLEAELAEYDALHDATLIEATGIEQLPTALIRARIACGLTQRQLAERAGLQEQAIQRYEATDYAGVSFARLVEIAEALDLTIHYDVRLTGELTGPSDETRDVGRNRAPLRRPHSSERARCVLDQAPSSSPRDRGR